MSKKNKARRQHHQPSGQRSRAGRDKPQTREVRLHIPAVVGTGDLDRRLLPPELRDLDEDAQFGVIIATGDNPAPPEGAGKRVGTLKAGIRASDGTVLPEGSTVWLDTRDGTLAEHAEYRDQTAEAIIGRPYGPPATTSNDETPAAAVQEYRERMAEGAVPAAFRARERGRRAGTAAGMVAALEDESQGLAQRLAQGLSPDELAELAPQIARAASIGGAEGGYVFTTGEQESGKADPTIVIEGVPDETNPQFIRGGRGSRRRKGRYVDDPGPVRQPRVATTPAEELRHELGPVTRAVLDAAPHHEVGDPAILALRASDVLDMHAQLADLMARPTDVIVQYYSAFIQQTISEAHKRGGADQAREFWENMFWPATTAREWTSILARLLSAARTYQVTAEMVEKVTAQYSEDLASGSYVIDSDDPPWPAGFAWLDAPLTFTDKFGKEGWNRVISWGPEILQMGRRRVPGSRIVSWSWHDDRDGWWTEQGGATMLRQGGLSMAHAISFPYNSRLNTIRDAQGRATQDDTIRWTRTLWRVLSSEIAATRTDSHIERHVAKRAMRSLRHDQVHVVTLRHRHYVSDGQPGHRDIQWSCQWPVNEFWRHVRRDEHWEEDHVERDGKGRRTRHHAVPDEYRENCAICGARVSFIGTFTKGPPGAPWRDQSNRTLYKLAR